MAGGRGMGDLVCGGIFFLTYIGVGFFLSSIIGHERFFFRCRNFSFARYPLARIFFPLFSQITHTLPPFKIQMVAPSLDHSQQWNPSLN